jgi:Dolichyl-phosphate-mannose-protein mannosyltransferase
LKHSRLEIALVVVSLALLSAAATALVSHFGWTVYYGDAEAHLNIARRIVDSRTPGYEQIGTVWLPLPHLLTLALVLNDRLWRNGLAGAIPSSVCFVVAGAFLYAAMRRAAESSAVALASVGLLALNPNLLYLQATPMTEPVFLACLMVLLYCTIRFQATQSAGAILGAAAAGFAASLARYEGWMLIPFVTLYFGLTARRRRLPSALLFGSIASLGPLYWIVHNWVLYSNPLEFFNGPYSAESIYRRALAQHMPPYPGDHAWAKAFEYFSAAAKACAGWGIVLAAAAGLIALTVARRRLWWPLILLLLPPIFYVWSMHSGGTPLFVPTLWPKSYYNVRYGMAALPLLAVAGGYVALLGNRRVRVLAALAFMLVGVAPWLLDRRPDAWVCWKESQLNSIARRAWTEEAAQFFAGQYHSGEGIFTTFGNSMGVLREAGIPLREALQENNVLAWISATRRPDLFLHTRWAIASSGDLVAVTVRRAALNAGPGYRMVKTIARPNAPAIEIYRLE